MENFDKFGGRQAEREFDESLAESRQGENERREKLWGFLNGNPNTILDAPVEDLEELIKAAEEHVARREKIERGEIPDDGISRTPWARQILDQLIKEGERRKAA